MWRSRVAIVRVLAGLALLAAVPRAQRLVESVPDPYTGGEPAAMAAAGYVSFGPFPFGLRRSSADVESLLGDEPLVWIETAHFRIGCALSPLRLRGDRDWVDRTQAELTQLKERLPRVKPATRELDPWLRAHLIALRCEALYAEVRDNLGATDATFQQAPAHAGRGDPRAFEGFGPHLGMEHKFSVLLLQRAANLARYTRAWHGGETQAPSRHHDTGAGLDFAVAEETADGLLRDDFALHSYLVYNLAANLYNGYRGCYHELPPWLLGGLAHWHARHVSPRFPFFERPVGGENPVGYDCWQWDERARGLLRTGAFEPIAQLMERPDLKAFDLEQHIESWALVDYLMSTRRVAAMKFLRDVKDPFHQLRRAPTREEVHERARERFEPAFGMTPEAMDAAWRAQVGGRRRK
ncbi:MAG: hypothetical protein JNM25_14780 [Planctomycetes bacterium]|nr:hypothetical protein [Planctomycetota bacterium]